MIRYACLMMALLATPALSAPMVEWDGIAKTYYVQGLTLRLSAHKDSPGRPIPTLTISASGSSRVEVNGEAGFDNAMASFGVGWFDPKAPKPQVEFATYTGGAHCCTKISVIERVRNSWKEVSLGEWDGDVPDRLFTDVDGDGIPDFVSDDNEFLYAFDSYSGSFPPPKILNVIGGKVSDVSKARRYAKIYRDAMTEDEPRCFSGSNGACAGYVANAARLGKFEAAWKFMLMHYNHHSNWVYPTRCTGPITNGSCKGQELKPRDYPQALMWFLEDNDYISKQAGN